MIDPSVDLWSLSGAACVSRVGGEESKKAKTQKKLQKLQKLQKLRLCLFFFHSPELKVDPVVCLLSEFCDPVRPVEKTPARPLSERDERISTTTAKRFCFLFFF